MGPEKVDAVGANAKMNEFCAAMGICNLKYIDEVLKKRKAVTQRYMDNLEGVEGIQLNPVQKDTQSNYSYFPVVFDEKIFGASRNEVYKELLKNDIVSRKYFYPLTSMYDCFHNQYEPADTPVALHICKRVLSLPLYPDLNMETVDRICSIILKCKL